MPWAGNLDKWMNEWMNECAPSAKTESQWLAHTGLDHAAGSLVSRSGLQSCQSFACRPGESRDTGNWQGANITTPHHVLVLGAVWSSVGARSWLQTFSFKRVPLAQQKLVIPICRHVKISSLQGEGAKKNPTGQNWPTNFDAEIQLLLKYGRQVIDPFNFNFNHRSKG